ncbi:MAG: ABC transporter ATP-binding protein, partial [Mesorhizobium sp.]
VDSYSNVQTLKLFSADGDDRYIRNGFDIYLDALRPFTRRLTGVRMALTTLSGVMITVIAGFAIYLWVEGSITVGAVAFTLSLVLRLNMLLGRVMMQLNGILRNLGVLENSKAMISQPLGLTDAPDAKELIVTGGRIDVSNVTFHYGKRAGVLDGINLVVRPGEKVGLVGPSGAGKTTLTNLILRLYDLEGGRILIDGQDIAHVTQ